MLQTPPNTYDYIAVALAVCTVWFVVLAIIWLSTPRKGKPSKLNLEEPPILPRFWDFH